MNKTIVLLTLTFVSLGYSRTKQPINDNTPINIQYDQDYCNGESCQEGGCPLKCQELKYMERREKDNQQQEEKQNAYYEGLDDAGQGFGE